MRPLKEKEIPLAKALFESAGFELHESLRVQDMEDGGMGSLLIQPGSSITEFGISEKYFYDSDGLLVTAKLNTTQEGKPAEIDIWKVDFSELKSWPTNDELLDNPPNK